MPLSCVGGDTIPQNQGYYGTDQGLVAITAARLGRAEDAVHFVLL